MSDQPPSVEESLRIWLNEEIDIAVNPSTTKRIIRHRYLSYLLVVNRGIIVSKQHKDRLERSGGKRLTPGEFNDLERFVVTIEGLILSGVNVWGVIWPFLISYLKEYKLDLDHTKLLPMEF